MAGLEVNSVNAAQGANGAKELKPQEEQKIGTVPVGQGYGAASGGGAIGRCQINKYLW